MEEESCSGSSWGRAAAAAASRSSSSITVSNTDLASSLCSVLDRRLCLVGGLAPGGEDFELPEFPGISREKRNQSSD